MNGMKLLICLFLDFKVRNGSFQIGIDSISSILSMMNKLLWNVALPKVLTPTLLLIKCFLFPTPWNMFFHLQKSTMSPIKFYIMFFKMLMCERGKCVLILSSFFWLWKGHSSILLWRATSWTKTCHNWPYMSRPIMCHPLLCIKLGFLYIVVHMMTFSLLE